eukprot:gene248-122_t
MLDLYAASKKKDGRSEGGSASPTGELRGEGNSGVGNYHQIFIPPPPTHPLHMDFFFFAFAFLILTYYLIHQAGGRTLIIRVRNNKIERKRLRIYNFVAEDQLVNNNNNNNNNNYLIISASLSNHPTTASLVYTQI